MAPSRPEPAASPDPGAPASPAPSAAPPAPAARPAVLPRPRDFVRLGPHDGAHVPAARVAVSVVLPLVVLAATGHLAWAPYAVFGAFASAFGRGLPVGPRLRMQLEAGAVLVACVVLGAVLSTSGADVVLVVVVIAAVAGVGSLIADVRRWAPPGPLFPVFGLGVCAFLPAASSSVGVAAVVAPASLLVALAASAAALLLPSGRRRDRAARTRAVVTTPALDRRRALLHAAVCLVGSLVAGLVSVGLGFENPYWAMVSAVVPVVGRATSTQLVRAGHRLVGTLLGVGVAAALLALRPGEVGLIVAFGVLQFAAELVVARNYGLTLLFITPMALGMRALAGPVDVAPLVVWRAVDTGVGVGVAVLLLLATHRLRRAALPPTAAPVAATATAAAAAARPASSRAS